MKYEYLEYMNIKSIDALVKDEQGPGNTEIF